ncbi:hypothetical protein HPB50_015239 [Hyalomma asiaticum]|uniref:Uncharacterized protein n=1 Tax=Hyalomma asiaticum TaxID=266040 RepID=A0ACB7TL81_HYAAI|nr:hypothetical protein HPB50_015239 [Hyalomma asiaticum]
MTQVTSTAPPTTKKAIQRVTVKTAKLDPSVQMNGLAPKAKEMVATILLARVPLCPRSTSRNCLPDVSQILVLELFRELQPRLQWPL